MQKWVTKNGITIFKVLSGRSNVYLITNGISCILIDNSVAKGWRFLNKKLDNLLLNDKKLSYLILTHAHFDHASNTAKLKAKYGCKVIIHRDEANYLSKGQTSLPKGTIFLTKWFDAFGEKAAKLVKYSPVDCDIVVDDVYEMSDFNSYIMHTPGHTVGSVSIIVDNEIAIVGDAMFGVLKWSIFPPFADNQKVMINSWKTLLDTGCMIFLPSHGTANNRELVQKQYKKYTKQLI